MGVVRRGRFRGKTGVVGVGVPTLPHTGRSPHAGRSLCIMWGSWGGGGGHCGGVRGRGRRISPTTAIGLWGDWGWLEGWGTCDMEMGTSPGADWTKVTNGAAIHPGSDSLSALWRSGGGGNGRRRTARRFEMRCTVDMKLALIWNLPSFLRRLALVTGWCPGRPAPQCGTCPIANANQTGGGGVPCLVLAPAAGPRDARVARSRESPREVQARLTERCTHRASA